MAILRDDDRRDHQIAASYARLAQWRFDLNKRVNCLLATKLTTEQRVELLDLWLNIEQLAGIVYGDIEPRDIEDVA